MAGNQDKKGHSVSTVSAPSPNDRDYMLHAITIAKMAVGTTSPNPPVACVIVKDGKILGSAHTAEKGRPHAETIALAEAGKQANGACAYVTLEPCAHFGQTPPCAESLIKAGIKRVVIALTDPFVEVNGKGIKMLQDAGIEVITEICSTEATPLYEGFFSVQQRGRPFITLKTATSLDGKIALNNGVSKWITGEESRNYVHLMRAKHDAIVTGIATIIADNPALTCRLSGMEARSPTRVVLDSNLSIPTNCNLVTTASEVPLWLATLRETIKAQPEKVKILEQAGAKLLTVKTDTNGKVCMQDTMQQLAAHGINNVMIEAGANINTTALRLGLVDRLAWFQAPIIIGNNGIPAFNDMPLDNLATIFRMAQVDLKTFGCDIFRLFNLYDNSIDNKLL